MSEEKRRYDALSWRWLRKERGIERDLQSTLNLFLPFSSRNVQKIINSRVLQEITAKLQALSAPTRRAGVLSENTPRQHDVKPSINGGKHEATPTINGGKHDAKPPIDGGKHETKPSINGGNHDVKPFIDGQHEAARRGGLPGQLGGDGGRGQAHDGGGDGEEEDDGEGGGVGDGEGLSFDPKPESRDPKL